MRILVDMDDTIEQLLRAWLACVNEKYNRNVQYDDIVEWNVAKFYPGLTYEEVYGAILYDEFWDTVEPMPYASEALKHIIDMGHEVYIVTATPYESVYGKMKNHLFKHFPYLTWDNVIITSHKQLIKGDMLIDDGVHNLEGGDYIKVLMTAPNNKSYDAKANGMIRVHNWHEIEELIKSFS